MVWWTDAEESIRSKTIITSSNLVLASVLSCSAISQHFGQETLITIVSGITRCFSMTWTQQRDGRVFRSAIMTTKQGIIIVLLDSRLAL